MPEMGMKTTYSTKTLLFGKTRSVLLALFYGHTGNEYYVNQIMQLVARGSGAVQRELKLMAESGVLLRAKKANLVYYRANKSSPIFSELKSMAAKGIFFVAEPHSRRPASTTSKLERHPGIRVPSKQIENFCRRRHITKLSLFGSVLRDDFRPDSDIDVLVEFEPDHIPGWDMVSMENELSSILSRKVDMHTREGLSRYIRDRVEREAEVQYSSG